MIVSFDHKALSQLYYSDKAKGLPPALVEKLNVVLMALDSATSPGDLPNFPGWRLHQLKGDLKGYWSISVSGNWRIIFRFEGTDVADVNLVDYH